MPSEMNAAPNRNKPMPKDKITKDTIAIMPVHLMDKPCEMDQIMKIAARAMTDHIAHKVQ